MTIFFSISKYLPLLLRGAFVSLEIGFLSAIIGFFLGTTLGLLSEYGNKLTKVIIGIYTSIIRGTPMLIQITGYFFLLPQMGITSNLATATIAIGLNSSAYISHIIRSGISAIEKGQIEAGKTLGLNRLQIIRYIMLPQIIRITIPIMGNELITLIKDSSLASIIGVTELYKEARNLINNTYDVATIYLLLAFTYLLITLPLSYIVNKIDKKLNKKC